MWLNMISFVAVL